MEITARKEIEDSVITAPGKDSLAIVTRAEFGVFGGDRIPDRTALASPQCLFTGQPGASSHLRAG